jgi:hypothetical protein
MKSDIMYERLGLADCFCVPSSLHLCCACAESTTADGGWVYHAHGQCGLAQHVGGVVCRGQGRGWVRVLCPAQQVGGVGVCQGQG